MTDIDFTTAAPERLAAMTRGVTNAIVALRDERPDDALDRLNDAIFGDGLLIEEVPALDTPEVRAATDKLHVDVSGLRLDAGWLTLEGDRTWSARAYDAKTPPGFDAPVGADGISAVRAIENLAMRVRENREWRATHPPHLTTDEA